MLPEYASKGHGEGFMHDTAMLLGALGWSAYDGKAEVVTPSLRLLRHRADQRGIPGHRPGRLGGFPPPAGNPAGASCASRL